MIRVLVVDDSALVRKLFGRVLSEEADFAVGFARNGLEALALLEQFKPVMKKIYQKHDWQEYGGAPLLGVNGYTLICHGRSESRAIKNAIRVGKQLVLSGTNEKIISEIEQSLPSSVDEKV